MDKMIPNVIRKLDKGDRINDIYSTLLEDRIIFIDREITSELASSVVAQLLYLESNNVQKDIYLYINSSGGDIAAGFAIFDTMNFIKCDISTICIGKAASMGAILLAAGAKHKRYALPNSEIMIQQINGKANGNASKIEIEATRINRLKQRMNEILSLMTSKAMDDINRDMQRDYYMDASEAKSYGIIDEIISYR